MDPIGQADLHSPVSICCRPGSRTGLLVKVGPANIVAFLHSCCLCTAKLESQGSHNGPARYAVLPGRNGPGLRSICATCCDTYMKQMLDGTPEATQISVPAQHGQQHCESRGEADLARLPAQLQAVLLQVAGHVLARQPLHIHQLHRTSLSMPGTPLLVQARPAQAEVQPGLTCFGAPKEACFVRQLDGSAALSAHS